MDINLRLYGKRVSAVLANGHVLQIRTADGAEVDIVWLDDNGVPLKGKPALVKHGIRLDARGAQEAVHYPNLLQKGCA